MKIVKEQTEKKWLVYVLWVGSRVLSIKYILSRRKFAFAIGIIGLLGVLVLWCGGCGLLDGYSITSDNCFIKYCADSVKGIVGFVKNTCYGDANVAAIWKKVISFFVWYGSLLFFVLRVQIGISQASVKISNWGVKTGFLMLVVLCLRNIYGESIILEYCFVITVLLFLVSAYGIFVRINPENLFYHVLEQAFIERKVICLLVNREEKEILPEYFKDRLIHVTTSVYQCLVFIVEKGMMNVYGGCSVKWYKEGLVFNEADFRQFLECSFDEALKYYKACLDGQVLLVKALYSKGYYEGGNSAIRNLLNLCPTWSFLEEKNCDVQKEYLVSLVEIALILRNKGILPKVVLKKLQNLALTSTSSDGLITVYKLFFIEAVVDNDITLIMETSYSIVNTLQRYGVNQAKTILNKKELVNDSKEFYGRFLHVLLLSAIKSIELGRSDIVSFMVKYCVSHFDTEIFEDELKKLRSCKCQDKNFDDVVNGDIIEKAFGVSSFDIDEGNSRYYLSKLAILLYGQQLFMQEHTSTICKKPTVLICIDDCVDNGWEYIFEKLFTEKYKLLWISYQNLDERCFDCNSFKKRLRNNLLKVMNNKNEDEFELWTTWIVDNMAC